MRRFSFGIILFISVLLVGAFSPKEASSEPKKAVKLKFGTWWPTVHVLHRVMEGWAKDMEASTEGRVKVKYYPAGTLLNVKTGLDSLSSGVADLAAISGLFYPGQLPSFQVGSMPFLFSSATHATRALTDMIPSYFDKECEGSNIKLLSIFTPPILQFISMKPIRKADDLKGLRIRSHGRSDKMLKLLGAIPVMVSPVELYTSLQRGIVDSTLYPLSAAKAFKVQEICRHVTVADLYVSNVLLAMNLDTWNGLPRGIQEKIRKSALNAARKAASSYDKAEAASYSVFEKAGATIYRLPGDEKARWKNITAPVADNWARENEVKGLPAKEMLRKIRELSEKYR